MALTKLTQSLIDGTLVTSVNGNTGAVTIEAGVSSVNGNTGDVTVTAGIDLQSTVKTANFTAVANEGYLVNTTSSAITITLPSSPSFGDEVLIIDYAGTFATNNATITSSNNIQGLSIDFKLKSNNLSTILVYSDATKGWLVKSAGNEGATALGRDTITTDFLVVAGGASGGTCVGGTASGGGGGAGGLRTSYGSTSGGGATAESALTLFPATNYTVTVGAGGPAKSGGNAVGNNGSDSVFATITSVGGGGGGGNSVAPNTGGSGGGGQESDGTGAAGTSGQGFQGGNGSESGNFGGGGGGAGSAGSNATPGSGLSVSITGSAVTYAAGGGTTGTGGSNPTSTQAANTGNGGIGGGSASQDGSSGIIVIVYPNTYTVSVGAGLTSSTTTSGNNKITTFTAGTDSISFS